MHISTHTNPICVQSELTGLLHPKLSKFKGILNEIEEKANEQVVEQFWTITNRMKSLRLSGVEKYRFSVFLQQQHHNHHNKLKLEASGYCWEPVTNWKLLREFDETGFFIFDGLEDLESLISKKEIMDIARIDFNLDCDNVYRNVWLPWDDVTGSVVPINKVQRELTEAIQNFVAFRQSTQSPVHMNDVKQYVCAWKGEECWSDFEKYCEQLFSLLTC